MIDGGRRWQLIMKLASKGLGFFSFFRNGKGGYKYSQGSLCPPGLWLGAARELASGSMED
jgi:hypothetical protein